MLSVVEAQSQAAMEHTVQLGVTLASESEVQRAYKLLSAGGTIKTPNVTVRPEPIPMRAVC